MSNWILSSSVLILIMMLLRFILRGKISLRLQYALWLLVAVRLLVPINFGNTFLCLENYSQPVNYQSVEAKNEPETVRTEPVIDESEKIKGYETVRPQKNEQEATAPETNKKILSSIIFDTTTIKILQTVWILGMLVIGFAFAASNLVFSYRICKTRKKLRVPYATIPVYVSDSIDTPCLYHLFHPTIYLTPSLTDDEKLLFHAVSHEMTHDYHKDLWCNVVRCVCLMIHWYNPLVWWAAVVSKRDCELACDEATIQRLGEKERLDYGKTLIKLTCRKQKDFFVVSTSMTAGRKSIRERIRLIAKKPKTTLIGGIILILVLVIATGCTFTKGVKNRPDRELMENTDAQTEPVTDDIDQSDTNITPTFYEEPDNDSVCLAVMPDGISKAGGDYRYIIPENQIYWVSEYKEMRSLSGGDGTWNEDEKSMGIWLVFHDEWTHVTDQGFIVNFDTRVNKENALDFYQLCMEEANKNGVGNPVRPEEITELSSATLYYNGTIETTDPEILAELQKLLSASKELRDGASCPFTASMDLQLKNHQTIRIYLATDSCSVWLSDGVYYQVY
ncbi:MAG: M56 family metallopeptidase, partial [Lachnospiraceae bacterium]